MAENTQEQDKKIPGATPRLPFSLRLRTSKSSKASMARIGRAYAKGEIDETVFKNLTWFMSQYIHYLKNDEAIDFDVRLVAIERILSKPRKEAKAC